MVAPLSGILNKLKGNIRDLMRKIKQTHARKKRLNHFYKMSASQKQDFAARLLQVS